MTTPHTAHSAPLPSSAAPEPDGHAEVLRRLKWAAIAGPLAFVGLVELSAWAFFPSLTAWPGRFILALVVSAVLLVFVALLFRWLDSTQQSMSRRNRELLALHHASLDIYGELSLDSILQKVVDQTRELIEARYGAVSVIADDGTIDRFVTSGIDAEQRAAIGEPPKGHGLLGVTLHEGQSLRLEELAAHPRAAGFPAEHPPMSSLLAVPITCKCSFRGNLYLASKAGDRDFTADDERTLRRFADQVAIAIDNADVHRRLSSLAIAEERARIAREMHDGMAQILAYANTKAQVVREHLRAERPAEAAKHLEQLASAAREAYSDAREGILALRAAPGVDESLAAVLRRYAESWQTQSSLRVEVDADEELKLDGAVELQLMRIVQEALSNARKHSGASRAEVRLTRDGERVVAQVVDDGRGFDPVRPSKLGAPRFGLTIMRERAESVGGTLSIDSELDRGTQVTVSIPISD